MVRAALPGALPLGGVSGHRLGDETADALGSLDEVAVGQVGVARRRAVTPVAEQLADLGQVLAGHGGVARYGMPKVVQAQPAELRPLAHRMPALGEAVGAPAFGQAREEERVRASWPPKPSGDESRCATGS